MCRTRSENAHKGVNTPEQRRLEFDEESDHHICAQIREILEGQEEEYKVLQAKRNELKCQVKFTVYMICMMRVWHFHNNFSIFIFLNFPSQIIRRRFYDFKYYKNSADPKCF